MQRSLATKLIAVLLLLALIAGGDRFTAMAMDMDGMQMSDMQKPAMNCQSCDGTMADMSCDAVCAGSSRNRRDPLCSHQQARA